MNEIVKVEDLKRTCILFESAVIRFLFSCNYAPATFKKTPIGSVIVAPLWNQVTYFHNIQ